MMLLLKTHQEHMDGVRKHRKHASDVIPRGGSPGEFLLVQVTAGPPGNETRRVRYAMRFRQCYEDIDGDSDRIWGYHWRYIIEGTDFRILRRPFDIDDVKVTDTNYGQGAIRFAYLAPEDEVIIRESGRLDCA